MGTSSRYTPERRGVNKMIGEQLSGLVAEQGHLACTHQGQGYADGHLQVAVLHVRLLRSVGGRSAVTLIRAPWGRQGSRPRRRAKR